MEGSKKIESSRLRNTSRLLLLTLKELLISAVPAVLIALVIQVYVAEATLIQQNSMEPNLHENERVIIEKLTYHYLHGPRRGDIVVIDVPGEEIPLVKRVIGLPGEALAIRGGQVWIDGEPLEEPWEPRPAPRDFGPTQVPPLHVFVIGDNRGVSRDSRMFGPVPIDRIVGRVWAIFWPLGQAGLPGR